MPKQKYSSLEQRYNEVVSLAVKECVLCGECVSNCLTFPLTPIKDNAPEDIMEKVIDFL